MDRCCRRISLWVWVWWVHDVTILSLLCAADRPMWPVDLAVGLGVMSTWCHDLVVAMYRWSTNVPSGSCCAFGCDEFMMSRSYRCYVPLIDQCGRWILLWVWVWWVHDVTILSLLGTADGPLRLAVLVVGLGVMSTWCHDLVVARYRWWTDAAGGSCCGWVWVWWWWLQLSSQLLSICRSSCTGCPTSAWPAPSCLS